MSGNRFISELGRDYAVQLDKDDELRHLRNEFIVPTKRDLQSKTLALPCEISLR